MIYLFCRRPSSGAADLVNQINTLGGAAQRLRQDLCQVRPIDLVVNWGDIIPARLNLPNVLNRTIIHNKYRELVQLAAAGVEVPRHELRAQRPAAGDWLVRTFGHQEARDLRANLLRGDYITEYIPTVREFRIHVFNGVIRAGIKLPREENPNPRFRSWNDGWRLDYSEACQQAISQRIRDVAKAAVGALGYDFGAVDVGVRNTGEPVVFEVNSAPGLEGRTIDVYAKAIIKKTNG